MRLRGVDVGDVDPRDAVLRQSAPARGQPQRHRRIMQQGVGGRTGAESAGGGVGLAAQQDDVGAELLRHAGQRGGLGGGLDADECLVVEHVLADPGRLQRRPRRPFRVPSFALDPGVVVGQPRQRRQRPPARQDGGHADAHLASAGQPCGEVDRLRTVAAGAPRDQYAERAVRHANLLGAEPVRGSGVVLGGC